MSVHRSISLWGVWYLQRKSTPKNEVLRLKTLNFWRLWKWRNWCDLEDLIFMRGLWSVKTFVYVVSFSLYWVIGNTVLLKGVEEILRKNFHVMLNSKSYTYQSLLVKPLEISYRSVIFFRGVSPHFQTFWSFDDKGGEIWVSLQAGLSFMGVFSKLQLSFFWWLCWIEL